MRHPMLACAALALALAASAADAQVRQQFGVMIPMRDGARLAADVWMPDAPGRYPVLLVRTPYMRTGLDLVKWGRYFAERGYVFAVQDTRGRGDSEGTFEFFAGDGKDGYDSIEWLAKQPFANGKVGTLGLSYLGTVQWLAAREHPPHLVCMAPTAPAGRWFEEIPYQQGAFSYAWALHWTAGSSVGRISQGNQDGIDVEKVLAHRPILTTDSVFGRTIPLYRAWLEHPTTAGTFWKRLMFTPADFAKIDIPTLTTTGWYDADQPGAMFYWRGLMANAPHKDRHFLIAGPWEHLPTFAGGVPKVGDTELGPEQAIDNKDVHLKFFDWCLKGSTASFEAPRARIFVTGANVWRTFDAYPPASMTRKQLFLASGGSANGASGDGRLVWDAPADSPPDKFTYDPHNPVPGLMSEMGKDRQSLQQRPDVLVYSTDALSEPVEIVGDVSVTLDAASDAKDTDFTAVLTDVYPDGRALKLGPAVGIIRARYRNGYAKEVLLTPGKTEQYRIVLFDVAHRFQAGHKIRLEISSSAAPLFNPNQNTGNPVATDTEWKVAHQTVYHDRAHASAIVLPVVSGGVVP